jgi:hypothetical protein
MNARTLASRLQRLEDDAPRDCCLCLEPRPGQTDDECVEEFYVKHPEARNEKSCLPFLFP